MLQSRSSKEERRSYNRSALPLLRSDRYQITGTRVHPQSPVLMPFDPWDGYVDHTSNEKTFQQPYLKILRLNRDLDEIEPQRRYFVPAGGLTERTYSPVQEQLNEVILAWVRNEGLLGLLPGLVSRIRVNEGCLHYREDRWLTTFQHLRNGVREGWSTEGLQGSDALAASDPSSSDESAHCDWMSPAGEVFGRHFVEQPGLTSLKEFFPAGEDSGFKLYRPNSKAFLEAYGETVYAISDWCEAFSQWVLDLSAWGTQKAVDIFNVNRARYSLDALSRSVVTSFNFVAGTTEIAAFDHNHGLLAAFARMFLLDRARGRRAQACSVCGTFFVSRHGLVQYCSPECRNTASSRRYRTRKEGRPPK